MKLLGMLISLGLLSSCRSVSSSLLHLTQFSSVIVAGHSALANINTLGKMEQQRSMSTNQAALPPTMKAVIAQNGNCIVAEVSNIE